jgi:ABC-type dipeptide/oligopeptide/nickel transport system permease component
MSGPPSSASSASRLASSFAGLGLLFYDSLGTADYPILLAYTLVGAALTIAGLCRRHRAAVAGPRIRLA